MSNINPHDLDAETGLLGAMLIDNGCIPIIRGMVRGDDFYNSAHRIIYKAIISLSDISSGVDIVTLKNHLLKMGLLEKCGGLERIVTILESVPTASNATYYAQIIKEKSQIRMAQQVSGLINTAKTLAEVNKYKHKLEEITNQRITNCDLLLLLNEFITETQRNKNGFEITTGLDVIDRVTMGYQKSSSYVIVGDTSHGKTALAIYGTMRNLARGIKINYYTYDMSARKLVARIASVISNLPLKWLLYPMEYQHEQSQIIEKTREVIKKYQVNNQLTVKSFTPLDQIESDLASAETGLVIIDFIQNAVDYADWTGYLNEEQKLRQYSMRCKELAEKYKCCMLLLSQFAKPIDRRTKVIRNLHDIKGASAIAQNADVVMLVEYLYKTTGNEMDRNKMTVNVAKNNIGITQNITVFFDPVYQLYGEFNEMQQEEEEQDEKILSGV